VSPAAPKHPRQQPVRKPHGGDEVQLEDRSVVRPRHGVKFSLRVAAGVVDKHVDAAQLALGHLHERLQFIGTRQVGGHRHGIQLIRQRVQFGRGAAGQDEPVGGIGQRSRDVRTDGPRGAGDESNPGLICHGQELSESERSPRSSL